MSASVLPAGPVLIAALIMADDRRVVRRASSRRDAAAKLELLLKTRAEGQAFTRRPQHRRVPQ